VSARCNAFGENLTVKKCSRSCPVDTFTLTWTIDITLLLLPNLRYNDNILLMPPWLVCLRFWPVSLQLFRISVSEFEEDSSDMCREESARQAFTEFSVGEESRTSFHLDGTKQVGSELTQEITGSNRGHPETFADFPQLLQASAQIVTIRSWTIL
jgi:hypothetical protein